MFFLGAALYFYLLMPIGDRWMERFTSRTAHSMARYVNRGAVAVLGVISLAYLITGLVSLVA